MTTGSQLEPLMTVPDEVVSALRGLKRPVLISHVVPDADALGSMFGLARAMQQGGGTAFASLPLGSLSQRLKFMADWASPHVANDDTFSEADGFVVLDTAKLPRCNVGRDRKATDWVGDRPLINIDHHATNTRFGTLDWVVDTAGSTCELVFYVTQAMGLPVDEVTASLLYAGIQTDTSGFSLPTTTPAGLQVASALAAHGARVGELGERLCRSQSQSEFNLLKTIYANTRVIADGRIAYSSASYEEIKAAGCTAADIDDQVDIPRSVDGAVMAMLFTEGIQGKSRINFRGSGEVTVVELAEAFGGGGHKQAAGSVLECSVDEAIAQVLPKAESHLASFV
ncbi:MAG: DHH family phosphoesterase [Phycisphaerae bacterium]